MALIGLFWKSIRQKMVADTSDIEVEAGEKGAEQQVPRSDEDTGQKMPAAD